jgi:hypothetical protein
MKHTAINVDDPEAFKESILDVICWTEVTIADQFRFVCEQCYINEDAGVRLRLHISTERTSEGVSAWLDLAVCDAAEAIYTARFKNAAKILRQKFHVELSACEGSYDWKRYLHLKIRHEYARPV